MQIFILDTEKHPVAKRLQGITERANLETKKIIQLFILAKVI